MVGGNNLSINVCKTKEMIVDFRKGRVMPHYTSTITLLNQKHHTH